MSGIPAPSRSATFQVTNGQSATLGNIAFFAYSAYINNPTPLWYEIGSYGWVAPYALGAVVPLDGAQSLIVRPNAPPGVDNLNPSNPDTSVYLTVVLSEVPAPASPGSPAGGGTIIGIGSNNRIVCAALPETRYYNGDLVQPGVTITDYIPLAISIQAHPDNVGNVGVCMFTPVSGSNFNYRLLFPGDTIEFPLSRPEELTFRFSALAPFGSAVGDSITWFLLYRTSWPV